MLKKMSIKKIVISLSAFFTLFLIYLIPTSNNKELIPTNEGVEYIDSNAVTSTIYLLDSYSYLGKAEVVVNNKDNVEEKCKELINVLISGGVGEDRIPNGFRSILPSDTKINSLSFQDGLVKINFSKELLNISIDLEEKMVEAIVYTLTSIEEVKSIIIYVDGEILTKLPQTGKNLPSTLDRNFGINKEYDLTSMKDIEQVTVYYVNKYNDNYYYVPVTKYLNDDRDKIKIIVSELSSSPIYSNNLMSFLNYNTKLLSVDQKDGTMNLEFNSYIFDNYDEKSILEEVIHTISLSVADNYDVKEVVFSVNEEEIYKSVLKSIE